MEITKKFKAKGMHCVSCEKIIEKRLEKIDGISHVKADYATETVKVIFETDKTDAAAIAGAINEKGYECTPIRSDAKEKTDSKNYSIDTKMLGFIFGLLGILLIGYFVFRFVGGIQLPEISQNMSYGLLFLVGLLTGFHCVSMCGGFVVSYTAKDAQEGRSSYKSHFMYGTGKLISYTVIGAAFGLLGSIITFTPTMRGAAGIIAGIFLVIYGLNMLNILPILRRFQLRTPAFISKFVGKKSQNNNSPFIIGLLNGLMIACGPLQAIYIMAAGTGSMIEGAKLLFVFALGTLPVMLGFGFVASFISHKATRTILKASGAIVIVLGLIMVNRGLALTGTGYDFQSIISPASAVDVPDSNAPTLNGGYQEINMEVNRYGWSPDKFVLKKGVPVKWIINGKELTGCNNAIQVPKLGLKFDIKPGIQVIEFTPAEEGIIPWSCWMGMIQGTFIVKENIDITNTAAVKEELSNAPVQPKAAGCGMGGGCGCGGRSVW